MKVQPAQILSISDKQLKNLVDQVVSRCLQELPDVQVLPSNIIEEDLGPMIQWHTRFILNSFNNNHEAGVEIFRNSTLRRFRQGVSVQSLGKSYEIWGEELWDALLSNDLMREPSYSLQLASLISSYLDLARSAIGQIYIEESSGRGASHRPLRPDLLEALIATDGSDDFVARLLVTLQIDITMPHVLLLIRPHQRLNSVRTELESALVEAIHLLNEAKLPIVANGIRRDDVVIICDIRDRCVADVVVVADQIARGNLELSVGVSDLLVGTGAFAKGFSDALNAINFAPGNGERRVYTARNAAINRLLRRSELGEKLRHETVQPILDYDQTNQTGFMLTLQTFIDTDFNAKATAQRLHLQPNTVRYRLKRIEEITGYSPFSAQGIFALMAGLRSIGPTWRD